MKDVNELIEEAKENLRSSGAYDATTEEEKEKAIKEAISKC